MTLEQQVEAMRRGSAANDAARDAGLTTPENIDRYDDIPYSGSDKWHLLDVYSVKGKGTEPVLINVHGGGFVYGDKEVYQYYCMSMAQRGFKVVSFNYRLAPDNVYPAALEDMCAAVDWVCKNAEEYGFDLGNVFMMGDSAGAVLLSQYALMYSSESYARLLGYNKPEYRLGAVLLNCGFYFIEDDFEPEGVTKAYFGDNPMADPVLSKQLRMHDYIDESYPPAYIMTSEGDFLRECARPMYELLLSRKAQAVMKEYSAPDKTLGHVFHIDQRCGYAARCNDEEAEFLRRHIV